MADAHLRAIITAVDRLSPVLARQSRMIRGWSKQFERAGKGAVPMTLGLGAALGVTTREFMHLEDASTQLQNTLMTSDGAAAGFEQLSKIAINLGNRLPGTTADFMAMASQLKALGVTTESLMGGALEAAANLAVVGKPLGVTYDQAAESIGKLSNAFGIAAQDLVPFADTVQRTLHIGVELEQLQYGMSRISGPLKAAGMQGLQVAKDMTPLLGMLIKAGISGEEAGTGIRTMITAAIAENRFTGVKGLVADLEKLNKLPVAEKMEKLSDLFGKEHASKAAIVAAGGYAELVKQMDKQASLQQRINNSLGTLTNLWDAATGSFQNVMAAFASSYAPELKALATNLNEVSGKALDWVNANKPMINTAVKVAAGVVGMKLAFMGVGMALAFVSRLMMMNPLGLFLQALAFAVPVIIANWDKITAFFSNAWSSTVNWLTSAWHNFTGGVQLGIEATGSVFAALSGTIKSVFGGAITWVSGLWQGFADRFPQAAGIISTVATTIATTIQTLIGGAIDWIIGKWQGFIGAISGAISSIGSFMSGLGNVNVGSMSMPGQTIQHKPIASSNSFKGSLDINHVNAPAGFRAAPVKARGGPFKVQQNVGYNYSVSGAW